MGIEAPTLLELEQLCDFAEARLTQLATESGSEWDGADPPTEWEWGCLGKTRAWLLQLKKMNTGDKIQLAASSLQEAHSAASAMLTVSTSHITAETAHNLNEKDGCYDLFVCPKGEYGWFIFVPHPSFMPEGVPTDLLTLLQRCQALNVQWLCLDCDGEIITGIPIYDWDCN